MRKSNRLLGAVLPLVLITAISSLQGCFPLVATGVAVGVMSAHDRRLTGVQTDDESAEWKATSRIPAQYNDNSHINFISYNRRMLVTGQVPNEEAKDSIGRIAEQIEGTKVVYNELSVAPSTGFSARSKDSVITSKIKARLVDTQQISANHIKVFTEGQVAYLMGIVSEREAKIAIQVARTTDGVMKVVNVMETLSDAEIRKLDATLAAGNKRTAPAAVENR